MKNVLFCFSLLLAILAGGSFCLPAQTPIDRASAKQMILVTTPDWSAVEGRLEFYERGGAKKKWRRIGSDVSVVVGRSGLAWGEGLHDDSKIAPNEPVKREGDGKSPAGVFRLTSVFGASEKTDFIRMPFTRLLATTECVDDARSVNYNRIVDRNSVEAADWNSSEKMLGVGEQYAWGIVVAHNANPPAANRGSCIFLHIWKDAKTGTAGCTAMPRENLEAILRRLDAKKSPVLVQLTADAREKLRKSWKLPTASN